MEQARSWEIEPQSLVSVFDLSVYHVSVWQTAKVQAMQEKIPKNLSRHLTLLTLTTPSILIDEPKLVKFSNHSRSAHIHTPILIQLRSYH